MAQRRRVGNVCEGHGTGKVKLEKKNQKELICSLKNGCKSSAYEKLAKTGYKMQVCMLYIKQCQGLNHHLHIVEQCVWGIQPVANRSEDEKYEVCTENEGPKLNIQGK
jgi:hypothetical protein